MLESKRYFVARDLADGSHYVLNFLDDFERAVAYLEIIAPANPQSAYYVFDAVTGSKTLRRSYPSSGKQTPVVCRRDMGSR